MKNLSSLIREVHVQTEQVRGFAALVQEANRRMTGDNSHPVPSSAPENNNAMSHSSDGGLMGDMNATIEQLRMAMADLRMEILYLESWTEGVEHDEFQVSPAGNYVVTKGDWVGVDERNDLGSPSSGG